MTAKKMTLKQALAKLAKQEKALALSKTENAKLEEDKVIAEKALDESMLDIRYKKSDYFIKKDNTIYIVGNLTTSLKFFETQTKIMTEILKMNENQRMKLNKFHSLLAIYLKKNLK